MLTKEPEMLQPDAFCERTMQQNATAAGAPPRTRLGEFTSPPDTLAGFKWADEAAGRGRGRRREGRGSEREKSDREGREGEGRRLTLMRTWNRADCLRPALASQRFLVFAQYNKNDHHQLGWSFE